MNYWQEKVKIGSLSFPRFIGGPLDGITDAPYRKLVREFSHKELLYTEMRHVRQIAHAKGELALQFEQLERPLNYQIAANHEEGIEAACEKILAKGVDCIDLNIGCPAKNVIKSGTGSALMADLPRLKRVLTTLRSCVPIPCTVKIRAGFKEKNAVDVALLAQDCGIDAVALHPRLQTEFFNGRPDYGYVAEVKRALSIPLLLSGNVINWVTARLAYEQTGVDGFLIGRGFWAKPWKLAELDAHSQGNSFKVTPQLIFSSARKHLDYMLDYYGDHGLLLFRKHLPFYLKGLPDAATLRKKLVVSNSIEEVKNTLDSLAG